MLPKRCLSFSDNCSSTRPTTILSLIISSVKVPKLQCSASVCNAVMNVWMCDPELTLPKGINQARQSEAIKKQKTLIRNDFKESTGIKNEVHAVNVDCWNLRQTTHLMRKKLAPIVKLEANLVKYLCQLCHARSPCYETLLWAIDQTVHTVFDWIEHTAFYHLRNLAQ